MRLSDRAAGETLNVCERKESFVGGVRSRQMLNGPPAVFAKKRTRRRTLNLPAAPGFTTMSSFSVKLSASPKEMSPSPMRRRPYLSSYGCRTAAAAAAAVAEKGGGLLA